MATITIPRQIPRGKFEFKYIFRVVKYIQSKFSRKIIVRSDEEIIEDAFVYSDKIERARIRNQVKKNRKEINVGYTFPRV